MAWVFDWQYNITNKHQKSYATQNTILNTYDRQCWDFQLFAILTSVDSDEPVQPPFKGRNSKFCSVSSLTVIEYSSD